MSAHANVSFYLEPFVGRFYFLRHVDFCRSLSVGNVDVDNDNDAENDEEAGDVVHRRNERLIIE